MSKLIELIVEHLPLSCHSATGAVKELIANRIVSVVKQWAKGCVSEKATAKSSQNLKLISAGYNQCRNETLKNIEEG